MIASSCTKQRGISYKGSHSPSLKQAFHLKYQFRVILAVAPLNHCFG